MAYAYLQTLKNGACATWVKQSKWAKYLVLAAVICGILAGSTITDISSTLHDISQPKTVLIDRATLIQTTREMSITITNTFSRGCDKIVYHMLATTKNGVTQYYSLPASVGGSNFSLSVHTYTVHITIPDTVPHGDYLYTVRSLYLCNFYGLTLFYPAETTPIKLHLD